MSHPITFGNGCTLEDCHTNLFALTDLDGINWRKLSAAVSDYGGGPYGGGGGGGDGALSDPVLLSFARCIQADVLCVWRRVQRCAGERPPPYGDQLGSSCHKELWIFWYGQAPSNLSSLLAPQLREIDQGSWENGLSYECRTLLFKALHNLIERCLLSQNFVRIGKWFVQPYDHHIVGSLDKSAHLSIQFSFFLHGESTVCASIDIRQHPPLRRLHAQHITHATQIVAHHGLPGVPVLLAPYGLAAILTGHTFRESDPSTARILDEWRQFYVLHEPSEQGDRLPSAVEVIVAGVCMRYPSGFVLLTADTETELAMQQPGMQQHQQSNPTRGPTAGLTPSSSSFSMTEDSDDIYEAGSIRPMPAHGDDCLKPVLDDGSTGGGGAGRVIEQRVASKAWQDCITCAHTHHSRHQQTEKAEDPSLVGTWDFAEPMQKNMCSCCKSKSNKQRMLNANQNKNAPTASNKHMKMEKGEKLEKTRHGARSVPAFHQRALHGGGDDDALRQLDMSMDSVGASYPNTQHLSKGVVVGPGPNTSFDHAIDSPHSAAPSPLLASQIPPSVTQNGDPTMPTLSPHPPPKPGEKCVGGSGGGQGDSVETVAPQPSNDPYVKAPASSGGGPNPASADDATGDCCVMKTERSMHWAETQVQSAQQAQSSEPVSLKRPLLPTNSYSDGDDLETKSLYDFAPLSAWLQQPMKRQRYDLDLSSSPLTTSDLPYSSAAGVKRGSLGMPSSPQCQPHDPYEFSDEEPIVSAAGGNFRKGSFRIKQEDDSRRNSDSSSNFRDYKSSLDLSPQTPGGSSGGPSASGVVNVASTTSLMQEKDLVATFSVPDKLFESESENSDSEALQVPSPGGSKLMDDLKFITNKGVATTTANSGLSAMGPTPTDLSRMFPTPPSLENQQNALSPLMTETLMTTPGDPISSTMPSTECRTATGGTSGGAYRPTELLQPMTTTSVMRATAGTESRLSSTVDKFCVYKPPQVYTFMGCAKYAPIQLPSSRCGGGSKGGDEVTTPTCSAAASLLLYRPSWQQHFQIPVIDKHTNAIPNHYANVPSVENVGSAGSMCRSQHDRPDTSPAMAAGPRPPRTPVSYELLQSPASNCSSYLNKNVSSVDTHMAVSAASGGSGGIPEAHSLVANVYLSDSILNLFKDHNFNSCTICVCNMNIMGADVGVHLPDTNSEPQYKCTCGFSAVANRRCGVHSGLFYEDEVDITGIRDDRLERRKPSLLVGKEAETIPEDILQLLLAQFSVINPSCVVLDNYIDQPATALRDPSHEPFNLLEIQDGCDVCFGALEIGHQAMDSCSSSSAARLEDVLQRNTCLHKWPYLQTSAKVPTNSQDVVRLLKSLQPLLQDAIQKKRSARVWEAVYTIIGPLSWKDFHLLSGRGADETSEPQPIPPILVGNDRDWLNLSPHALRYWDKLLLEPYGRARDITYVVVTPDNDHVLAASRNFFSHLSSIYELCRLGRHRPIGGGLRDGLMRVGKTAASKLHDQPVDDWFTLIGGSSVAAKLRLYARVCRHRLAPFLLQEMQQERSMENGCVPSAKPKSSHLSATSPLSSSDSQRASQQSQSSHHHGQMNSQSSQSQFGSVTNTSSGNDEKPADGSSNPSTPKEPGSLSSADPEADSIDCGGATGGVGGGEDRSLLVYMIDPFSYGYDNDELKRLAMLGLLRCFREMLATLPANIQHGIQLQIVPLQTILDFRDESSQQVMKNLAMSVYTQCRRVASQSILGRPLTSFGPAASANTLFKSKPADGQECTVRLYSPPYTLATERTLATRLRQAACDHNISSGILLCAYCLSADQRWLLAVCTDSRGELMETCTISIDVPNRRRRQSVSARRPALRKLWQFLLGVISGNVMSWRLVVGRFGRLGHGELTGWAGLLSKTNLQLSSKQLKQSCSMCCNTVSNSPLIASACLVSLEVHPNIHIMTDTVKMEEKQSGECPMTTPHDASVTHILVFPTSATAQANQPQNQQGEAESLLTMPGLGDDLTNDFGGEFDDILGDIALPVGSPGSPKNSGSPTHGAGMSSGMVNGHGKVSAVSGGGMGAVSDPQDDPPNLLQQPLAMGFYVSTAKTGPLPKWFWSACPEREHLCPTCFKAALHIHCLSVSQSQDEFLQMPHKHEHPLDSNLTCDVLRYVLEMYNALSWLTIDPTTDDRRSCLPAHLVVLMQLYFAMDKFV